MAGGSKSQKTKEKLRPWIVWLQDDLRLQRHPGIRHAAAHGPVLPLFVIDEASPRRQPGAAARWWQRRSLQALDEDIAARGGELILRRGAAAEVIAALARETGAAGVAALRLYEAAGAKEQHEVERAVAELAPLQLFAGDVLVEPGTLLTKSETPFRVFTPFWRALSERLEAEPALADEPASITWYNRKLATETVAALRVPDEDRGWTAGLEQSWQPGEKHAHMALAKFTNDALVGYEEDRNLPAVIGTSRLSPHLRFGEIGIRDVWEQVARLRDTGSIAPSQCIAFLRELAWRDFCRHLLFHFPQMTTENFRPEYDRFQWRSDAQQLRAWKEGRTGYPFVDAGMRELWKTGWMHNRVRMVAASFLTKHLRIHWREGEAWFWDTLVDADYANNPANWQWTAGTGADAAPYFRIFNPTTQAHKFDSKGEYLRRWLPDLDWAYPEPIVDHAEARAAALAANAALK